MIGGGGFAGCEVAGEVLLHAEQLAREHDILFFCDEVISGFGRMGCWFLSEMWDLQPDLMILAKGLTSGYVPMGATMVSSEGACAAHWLYRSHGEPR